jgi:hypothetical protein
MTFEIGEKVVCVDDKIRCEMGDCVMVEAGRTYVVRGVYACPGSGIPVVLVIGVQNPIEPKSGLEFGYYHDRFRRLADMQLEAAVKQWRGIP